MPLLSDTGKPPEGAGAVSVAVHVAVPGAFTVDGEQLKLLMRTDVDGVSVSVVVWLAPPRTAVTIALCALLTFPVEAVKVALLWLAATVTLGGTVTTAWLLLRATEVELAAALFSDTAQVLVALLPNVDGVQVTPVKVAGATKPRVTV